MKLSHKHNKVMLTIAMIACYAMIFVDESGIAVTLTMIQKSLSLSANAVHWTINSYLLALSVLLLFGGKLSDIYGRRKIFIIGIILFLLASIICALAENQIMLLLGRSLQGIGASFLMPCITVMIHKGFSDAEFGKVFGIILGVSNFFYAIGPFIAGLLTQYVSWRYFFWINIPLGLISLLLTLLSVENDIPNKMARFSDVKGLIIFVLTITSLIFAIMQGAEWGWDNSWIAGLFVFAMIGFCLFVIVELRASTPLLEMHLFLNKAFFAGNIILFCSSLCLAVMVFWAFWLQKSAGFSPATVGAALLPATLTFIFIPSVGGAWQDKSGSRAPLLLGTGLILVSIIWVTIVLGMENYYWLLLGLLIFGFGIPLAIPNSIVTILKSVNPEQSGMASGAFTTMRQIALSFGIAVLSAIITSYNNNHLSQLLKSSSDYTDVSIYQINILLAGKNVIEHVSPAKLTLLKQAASAIYTHALISGMIVIGIFAAVAFLCSYFFIGKKFTKDFSDLL